MGFAGLDDAYRARPLRERILIGAMIVALAAAAVDALLVRPLDQEHERVRARLAATEDALATIGREIESLAQVEPDPALEQLELERSQLTRQIETIDARLRSQVEGLLPPGAVVAVLEDLLRSESGLRLVRLEAHEPERLGAPAPGTSADLAPSSIGRLYRHGLTLEIEGGYGAAVAWLERIEGSGWRLLWDRFELEVTEFPNSTVTIDLHTIGETEEWIGV